MDFKLLNQNSEEKCLGSYKGKILVLYFYPKDNTPGCTSEAKEFSELYDDFKKLGAEVVGVSGDGIKAHNNFIAKHDLKIELLSDPGKELHKDMDVIKMKTMFGKTALGTVRSTFIFDREGKLIKEFRNVKAKGHAKEVLDFLGSNDIQ